MHRGALDHPEHFLSLQVPYSAIDRRMESQILPRAKDQTTGVVFRSIFLQGVLSHRLKSLPDHLSDLQKLAGPIADLAEDADIGLGELALRFAAFSPWSQSTIFGTTHNQELADNLRAINAGPLPDDLIEAIYRIEITDPTMLDPGNWHR